MTCSRLIAGIVMLGLVIESSGTRVRRSSSLARGSTDHTFGGNLTDPNQKTGKKKAKKQTSDSSPKVLKVQLLECKLFWGLKRDQSGRIDDLSGPCEMVLHGRALFAKYPDRDPQKSGVSGCFEKMIRIRNDDEMQTVEAAGKKAPLLLEIEESQGYTPEAVDEPRKATASFVGEADVISKVKEFIEGSPESFGDMIEHTESMWQWTPKGDCIAIPKGGA
eukprot:CAMPEP_0169076788 /NCGR_PEP_ID=MMETSP1015-20121227/8534_1 /TAXON_ID=342587 /ORGANISM="Karlodinium micrum, Strain CCMP2283" /LENGTH=219 /DNA_ID=CAMNT_0009136273 /DNA_START=59 /DNA_END=717 /DNA_ORIENTATION=-